MGRLPANLVGHRYGKLMVIGRLEITRSGSLWLCRCDCGGERRAITSTLRALGANSGCKACEFAARSLAKTTHGESPDCGKTKLYMIWKGMHGRCRDEGNSSFAYYGAKGIRVCAEWSTYEPFRDWALASGYVEGMSIDRDKPWMDYSPAACEWVTRGENTRRMVASRRDAAAWMAL